MILVCCNVLLSRSVLPLLQGGFKPQESIAENARLSGPLLSRFDVVLALRDLPDKEWDTAAADHILYADQHEVSPAGSAVLLIQWSHTMHACAGG